MTPKEIFNYLDQSGVENDWFDSELIRAASTDKEKIHTAYDHLTKQGVCSSVPTELWNVWEIMIDPFWH